MENNTLNSICPQCKKILPSGGSFCPYCGTRTLPAKAGEGFEETLNLFANVNPSCLRPGTILHGKYRINSLIGQGGFGITYDGTDLKLDMHVAVKEYFPRPIANRQDASSREVTCTSEAVSMYQQGLNNFLKEARNMAKFVGEENFIAVHDYFAENNTAYIIMEFVQGQDLKHYLRQHGPLSMDAAMRIAVPVMNALERIHAKGMIHRDVSPSNIMLLDDGRVKLLDFGAVRDISLETQALTTMSAVYKYGYSPIEQQTRDMKQGTYSDIYALCATLYEMLTGEVPPSPFKRLSGEETLAAPSAMGVKISPSQEAALLKGLEVHGADRIQTIGELRSALCEVAKAPAGGPAAYSGGGRISNGAAFGSASGNPNKAPGGIGRGAAGGPAKQRRLAAGTEDAWTEEDGDIGGRGGYRGSNHHSDKRLWIACGCLAAALVILLVRGALNGSLFGGGQHGSGKTPTPPNSSSAEMEEKSEEEPASDEAEDSDDSGNAAGASDDSGAEADTFDDSGSVEETPDGSGSVAETPENEDSEVQGFDNSDAAEETPEGSGAETDAFDDSDAVDEASEDPAAVVAEMEEEPQPVYDYPEGSLEYNGHHYYIYDDVRTDWEDAMSKCLERGGFLAVINDSGENEILFRYMQDMGFDTAYFGLSLDEESGTWGYLYGDSSDFRDWGVNSKGVVEPNNSGGKEKHVELDIHMHDGHWNDARYGKQVYTPDGKKYKNSYAYICEWED